MFLFLALMQSDIVTVFLMHLETLRLQRFRSCEDTTVKLQPDLTVLVGENSGGKSNIVDALRLLTLPVSGRRDRYPEIDDLRRGHAEADFRIEGRYSGMSVALRGLLVSAVPDPTEDLAIFGMRHQTATGSSSRGVTTYWAGKFEEAEPERGSTDLIRHVYLPPLRDAQKALGSGSATRIFALLKHFLEDGEKDAFLDHVRRDEDPHRVVQAINEGIGTALASLTGGVRPQTASLDFAAEDLFDVARDLRFRLADAGLDLEEIRTSGLGYANLLYMATVVVELTKARDADLTLFLVEEPEAHLHPQLQMLVLEFLLDQAQKSSALPPVTGRPEGRVQVIVTTHSPNLTAWVSPKHLVVIRSLKDDAAQPVFHRTVSVPVADLGLKPKALNKVSRYLDVTRSALLFGSRALLVEGITEVLLMPVIAKHVVLNGDADAWQRFQGTVLASIEGVDFKPYVEILLRPHGEASIADRLVVVTDADPNVPGNRQEDLEALAAGFGAGDKLSVHINVRTLEHELFAAGNEKLLKLAFLALHPNSEQDWTDRVEGAPARERPDAFMDLIAMKRTKKGDLAQEIACRIAKGGPLVVPNYIRDAIAAVAAP